MPFFGGGGRECLKHQSLDLHCQMTGAVTSTQSLPGLLSPSTNGSSCCHLCVFMQLPTRQPHSALSKSATATCSLFLDYTLVPCTQSFWTFPLCLCWVWSLLQVFAEVLERLSSSLGFLFSHCLLQPEVLSTFRKRKHFLYALFYFKT